MNTHSPQNNLQKEDFNLMNGENVKLAEVKIMGTLGEVRPLKEMMGSNHSSYGGMDSIQEFGTN